MVLCRGNLMAPQYNPQPSIQVMIASDKEGLFGYSCPRCAKYFRASDCPSDRLICPYCLHINNALSVASVSGLIVAYPTPKFWLIKGVLVSN